MAHFYGSMNGGRGETTRTGHKTTGMSAHLRGWNIGTRVQVVHRNGADVVEVYATTGSNAGHRDALLLFIHEDGRVEKSDQFEEIVAEGFKS